ncbi:MAG TPA: DotU family type IV/VI secretion system protein, partial [Stellaceae bacterium]|nr:DotU family type IV/VI secretion system protein [Stellaceae bacterium]
MSDLVTHQPRSPILAGQRIDYSLPAQLRAFYHELLRVQYALKSGARSFSAAIEDDGRGDAVIAAHQHLKALLERNSLGVAQGGGMYGAELYREAQYVMAALADEALLSMTDWAGRAQWSDHLLEAALFGTRIAGERLFDNIEALAAHGTAANPELAALYLVVLSLGFRGRYRAIADHSALRRYRGLLRQILDRHAGFRIDHDAPLFAEAYAHTLEGGRPVRLPHLRPWLIAIAAAVLAYVVVGHVIW